MNIRKSQLHSILGRVLVFPCLEVIEWIIDCTLLEISMFVDTMGNNIGSFLAKQLEKYYKFQKPEVMLVTYFVNDFYDKKDVGKILSN